MTRRIGPAGLALIRRYEGFSAVAYACPAGYATIGYGHRLRGDAPQDPIDRAEAERLLLADLTSVEAAIDRLLPVPLTSPQFDALASFTFNLGSGALQRSALRRRVMRGDHDRVADEFARWVFAGGRKLAGLVARRAAEAELFRSGG